MERATDRPDRSSVYIYINNDRGPAGNKEKKLRVRCKNGIIVIIIIIRELPLKSVGCNKGVGGGYEQREGHRRHRREGVGTPAAAAAVSAPDAAATGRLGLYDLSVAIADLLRCLGRRIRLCSCHVYNRTAARLRLFAAHLTVTSWPRS